MTIIKATSDKITTETAVRLAKDLIKRKADRAFIALSGDLGAGKTVFASGMASVLSPGSRVKSPTYTIVNEYLRGEIPLYHFDFYRITDPDELYGIGFEDYLDGGICIGEWCENVEDAIPKDAIRIEIIKDGENCRIIKSDYELSDEEEP